jgi:hypothetical protein
VTQGLGSGLPRAGLYANTILTSEVAAAADVILTSPYKFHS